jgi:hypothetical protein
VPRIAATLGSFLLVACAIGVNTARYPVVWEMVVAAHESPGPEGTTQPVAPPETAPVPASAADAGTAGQRSEGAASQAATIAPTTPALPSTPSAALEPDRLEPVGRIVGVRPIASPSPEAAASPTAESGVRRLPPVDGMEQAAATSPDSVSALPAGQIPVYPSTATP